MKTKQFWSEVHLTVLNTVELRPGIKFMTVRTLLHASGLPVKSGELDQVLDIMKENLQVIERKSGNCRLLYPTTTGKGEI